MSDQIKSSGIEVEVGDKVEYRDPEVGISLIGWVDGVGEEGLEIRCDCCDVAWEISKNLVERVLERGSARV